MSVCSKTRSCFVCFVIAVMLPCLASSPIASAAEPLNVWVVNYPLKYVAERIGGQWVKVTFPAPPDVDPAYWLPDIAVIAGYQQADLILLNGADYAQWVDKVTLPRSTLVNTSATYKDRYIPMQGAVTHSHGPEGEHAHKGFAFTTWLDFDLAQKQAEAVADAFIRKLPEQRQAIGQNLADVQKALQALDSKLRQIVSRHPAQPLVASHPVYDYLARRYAMNIQSVHWEPDQVPDDSQWMELQTILDSHRAGWMIWEGTPDPAIVSRLESIGISSTVFDPCGNSPQRGDFLEVMQQNVENMGRVYNP